jgi:5-methylcytosine-specific restriction endonuclease McrA
MQRLPCLQYANRGGHRSLSKLLYKIRAEVREMGLDKKVCNWCGEGLSKPRIYWCSDECSSEYSVRDGSGLRTKCLARDQGICALCGLDCGELERRLTHIALTKRSLYKVPKHLVENLIADMNAEVKGVLHLHPWIAAHIGTWNEGWPTRSFWEADHKIPVVRGGWSELSNVRTLCIPCHKAETKKLAGQRAASRRP